LVVDRSWAKRPEARKKSTKKMTEHDCFIIHLRFCEKTESEE
jgi:hypothetical protein